MGEAVLKLEPKKEARNSLELIKDTHTEELVIALCGQLGTDIGKIQEILVNELRSKYNYICKEITLSHFISQKSSYNLNNSKSEYDRIIDGMNGGNELRALHGDQVLSEFAIQEIIADKLNRNPHTDIEAGKFNSIRVCYVITSIKHPAEIRLLREVYRNLLYVIGIFSPLSMRVKRLEKLLKNHNGEVYTLINRDTGEDLIHGQNVEEAFISSDYFIRCSSEEENKLKPKVIRFLDLIFDIGIKTPTFYETAMYQATTIAANSSCLSRQVGACITDANGVILTQGWNDVPKAGGNLYPDLKNNKDGRCYNIGSCECANTAKKRLMKESILKDFKNSGILKEGNYEKIIFEILKNNGIDNLIEFARSVHAEMHAIIIGSQNCGDKIIGGKLFCTTYPCHNCARHIIVAGISEVYYIEPYKKSLCIELHSDAITEDENEANKVKILMYEGVAPSKYMEFYKLISDNRKTKLKTTNTSKAKPKNTMTLRALHELEAAIVENLQRRDFN